MSTSTRDPLNGQPRRESSKNAYSTPIDSFCHVLSHKASTDTCLGYVEDDRKRFYLQVAPVEQLSQSFEAKTFYSLMDPNTPLSLRLKVAVTTAFLVGTLGATPWLTPEWASSELFLVPDLSSTAPQPYVVRTLPQAFREKGKCPISSPRRKILLVLGVALLELLFGETLESQPFRSQLPSDDPWLVDLCAALQWQQQAELKYGQQYANAIGWCLSRSIDVTHNMGDSASIEGFWTEVISPLEEFIRIWTQDPVLM